MEAEGKKEAKKARRNAKSALTRLGNTLNSMIENNRPAKEIKEALGKLQGGYENVETKHESFIDQVEDDDELAKEEEWTEECREKTISLQFKAKDYLKVISAEKGSKQSRERRSRCRCCRKAIGIRDERQRGKGKHDRDRRNE